MAVYAYIRTAIRNDHAVDRQFDLVNAYAVGKGLGLPLENIYYETASGRSSAFSRPVFLELWRRIRPHDLLLVAGLDRLARTGGALSECLRALGERQVGLALVEPEDEHD